MFQETSLIFIDIPSNYSIIVTNNKSFRGIITTLLQCCTLRVIFVLFFIVVSISRKEGFYEEIVVQTGNKGNIC